MIGERVGGYECLMGGVKVLDNNCINRLLSNRKILRN